MNRASAQVAYEEQAIYTWLLYESFGLLENAYA